MKILKSDFHNKTWNNKRVESFLLSDLWPSVEKAENLKGKPFYSRVKADIEKNGLKFPLIVVKRSYEELQKQKKKYPKGMRNIPSAESFKGYVIWGGSNRFRIAEELSYTHIDIVIYDDYDQARKDQRLHREPFQRFY